MSEPEQSGLTVVGEPVKSISIEDLRPMLGEINWQLRRINKCIAVDVDDGLVVDVKLVEKQQWSITCDCCGKVYASYEKVPHCPQCGTAEIGPA